MTECRCCSDCGADILGNDPHGPTCQSQIIAVCDDPDCCELASYFCDLGAGGVYRVCARHRDEAPEEPTEDEIGRYEYAAIMTDDARKRRAVHHA